MKTKPYKKIPLTKGYFALVDTEDYEKLAKYGWHISIHAKDTLYARRSHGPYMHNAILPKKAGLELDHINRNGIDNRKSNLRYVTIFQNRWNYGRKRNNRSGFIGVSYNEASKKWLAQIKNNRKYSYLGVFDKKRDAAIAYDMAALMARGSFAETNILKLIV